MDTLYDAASRGDLPAVNALVASGADVNKNNNAGESPLFIASKNGHLEIVNALLASGADVNKNNNDGLTPLSVSILYKRFEIVKVLLAYGADVNKAPNKMSPLYLASHYGHLGIVKALLASGANVNVGIAGEKSPLYIASQLGHLKIVKALLASGADVNIRNVLQYARDESFEPEINKLILSKAKPTIPTINQPSNAPLQCFDPLMANEVNISTSENAVFYIQDSTNKTKAAGCLDQDTLKIYKSEPSYVFYKCKESVPVSALYITRNSVRSTKYRLLNFAMRIYVKDSEAQQLKIGQSYVLKPVEPIGRLASKSVVDGGSLVSALHCGPADGSYLYSIHKVGTVGSSSSSSAPAFSAPVSSTSAASISAAYGDGGDAAWQELLREYQGGRRNRKTIRRRNNRKRTTRKYRGYRK